MRFSSALWFCLTKPFYVAKQKLEVMTGPYQRQWSAVKGGGEKVLPLTLLDPAETILEGARQEMGQCFCLRL